MLFFAQACLRFHAFECSGLTFGAAVAFDQTAAPALPLTAPAHMLSFLYLLCVLPVIRNRLPIVAVVAELVDHNFQSVVFELELLEVY